MSDAIDLAAEIGELCKAAPFRRSSLRDTVKRLFEFYEVVRIRDGLPEFVRIN